MAIPIKKINGNKNSKKWDLYLSGTFVDCNSNELKGIASGPSNCPVVRERFIAASSFDPRKKGFSMATRNVPKTAKIA